MRFKTPQGKQKHDNHANQAKPLRDNPAAYHNAHAKGHPQEM